MLTAADANAKTAAINSEFATIGYARDEATDVDTRMPRSKKNTEAAAWDYHVASQLLRAAEARREKAHKACVTLGVMFDHKKNPDPVGTDRLVYPGDVVEISVKVTTATTKLDAVELGVRLVKAGLSIKIVEKLYRECTVENDAPHKFTTSLVTK